MTKYTIKHYLSYIQLKGILFVILFLAVLIYLSAQPIKSVEPNTFDKNKSSFEIKEFRKEFSKVIGQFPDHILFNKKLYGLDYTINSKLQQHIHDLLNQFRPDYASVAVIDNNNGNIIGLYDYSRSKGNMSLNLILKGEHPSASLFKIITSADLLQNTSIAKSTTFNYLGRSTTLFKYQLLGNKNKFFKSETLAEAFAKSNNVIFGRAAIGSSSRDGIIKMAQNLGFYEELIEELPIPLSKIYFPNDMYGLAELASGFNTETTMTSIHGALIASIVANSGQLKFPSLLKGIFYGNHQKIWSPDKREKKVLEPRVTQDLLEMMEQTVKSGTAKKVFRPMSFRFKENYKIGGKTGSITGGEPFGKRDWFTSFAIPQNNSPGDKGISVCVMIINVKKWYVKSAYVARKVMEYYFDYIQPEIKSESLKQDQIVQKTANN